MMNVEQARFNMVEQQIRPWDVLDFKVLDLLQLTPREEFVPKGYEELAFADMEIPLDHGEVMLAPKIVARMMQAANIHESDSIFEVGTGTGYGTALLAKAAREVESVDIHPDFIETAQQNLTNQGIDNVTLDTRDAAQGVGSDRLYDVIIITGSLPTLPDSFQHSLQRGGRLVAVVGNAPVMQAVLITRSGDNEWSEEVLFETEIPPLRNVAAVKPFTF